MTQVELSPTDVRKTNSMRAAVIEGPGKVRVVSVDLPTTGPGQVRVRLEGCGVCASNVPPWEGREWFHYPLAPGQLGHEGWGIVDEIGAGVSRFQVGDRVGMLSNHAYAQYDVAAENQVVLLPPILDDYPFPAEPLGCAMNILQRSGIEAGQTVAIVGAGFLGALLTRLGKTAGARVIAISRRAYALGVARSMGADEMIEMDDHGRIIQQISALTGGKFCEVVIEATGKPWPLDLAGEITRERGRLVIAGYHQDGLRHINMQLWNWRGLDVINAHERDPEIYAAGMRAACQAVMEKAIDPARLYTHRFPLEQLDRALDMTRDRPDGFLKALIMM